MKRGRFTKEEARGKVGAIIKTRVEFAGVPRGTRGRVVKIDDMGGGEWDVVIRWVDSDVEDWFTKDEYEKYLEELSL